MGRGRHVQDSLDGMMQRIKDSGLVSDARLEELLRLPEGERLAAVRRILNGARENRETVTV